ncbi:sulfatase-like hydrolase/transferase [Microvirga sp. BT689]|uniref:sulfatase-like hydrolase/transferase n=1 Tax=Microvirga arvi TaxID=2778731 RepID=UPI0019516E68|nr:sulfatase-like hydrolase/transferase [Microvirga arvi]MBM6582632.1 sulfatase-like hydrolase/transferase [Microvirga arvi]
MLKRPFIIDALHLFALCSFAVAQPLYDLLAPNVEFFVAHRAGLVEILILAAGVSFGLPLILIGIEAIVGLASSRARQVLHIGFVAVLIAAGALIAINRLTGLQPQVAIGLGLATGVLLTVLYTRSAVLQRFCTIASAFAIFLPIYLVGFTPLSSIYRSAPVAAKSAEIGTSTPVVVVVFDEFNLTGLLNERQEIDAIRFPNFAALAGDAWWFRRATAINPATIKAVPAILTGLTPGPEVVPPSIAGFPNNLFTWLGSSYRFNVTETVTELCPRTLCRTSDEPENRVDLKLMASDLSIIYLHTLLPANYASMFLPPIDNGWNGFAVNKSAQSDHDADEGEDGKAHLRRNKNRAEIFSSFLSRVEAGDKTLDFLHFLLPHSPYVYLPSGQAYPGGADEGVLPNAVWSDNEYLVRLQYQRFLLQAGYADKLIGDLISKLKQLGKYEKSLIVVTADHGKAFKTGVLKRTLSEGNAPEILQIPLFVKLPNQSEGKISDRPVSNLDILPTIGDVLAAPIPWDVHGISMTGENFPDRDVLKLQTRKGPEGQFTFDRAAVTSFPRLSWKVDNFGTETPLTALRLRGEHYDLVGKSVLALPIDNHLERVVVSLDVLGELGNVDPEAKSLPVYWHGEVKGLSESEKGMALALALNGAIEAVVPMYTWNNKPSQFSAVIPQTALKAGANDFRAFLVRQNGTDQHLTELMVMAPPDGFEITKAIGGAETLLSSTGRRVSITPGKVEGWVDQLTMAEVDLNVVGWAADAERKVPVAEIVLFAGGKFVYAGQPNAERPDVGKALNAPELTRSGYNFRIPSRISGTALSSVRVFGITESGIASELSLSPKVSRGQAATR